MRALVSSLVVVRARRPDIPRPDVVVFDDLWVGNAESAVRHIDRTG